MSLPGCLILDMLTRSMRAAILSILVPGAITGCRLPFVPTELAPLPLDELPIGPSYARPGRAVAGVSVSGEGESGPRDRSLVVTGGEATLDDLRRMALERNASVGEWTERVAAAEARRGAVRARFFPTILADGSYLRLEDAIESEVPGAGTVTFQAAETWSLKTQLRYSLNDWGRNLQDYQASLHELRSERAARQRALQDVAWAVTLAYFGLLQSRRDVEILESSVSTLEGALRLARDFHSVGRATRADLLVVQARLERRRFQVLEARELVIDLDEELHRLLDLPREGEFRLAEPPGPPDEPAGLDELEAIAIGQRPELRALDEAYQALRRRSKALGAAHLPELFFFLQHDFVDSPTVLAEESLVSGGFGLSWAVFDGGRKVHEMGALKAEAAALREQARGLASRIVHEVRRARRLWDLRVEAVEVAAVVVEQAAENLRRVQDLFAEGRATGQEVLEAENLLTAERARQARAAHRRHLARWELRHALGLDEDDGPLELLGRGARSGSETPQGGAENDAEAKRDADDEKG